MVQGNEPQERGNPRRGDCMVIFTQVISMVFANKVPELKFEVRRRGNEEPMITT